MGKYNEKYVEVNKIINESPIDTFCVFWETDVYFKTNTDDTIRIRTHDKVLSYSEAYLNEEPIPIGTYSTEVYIDYRFNNSDITLRTVDNNIVDSIVYSNDSLAKQNIYSFTYSCDNNSEGYFKINVIDKGMLGTIQKGNIYIYNTNLNELDNFVTKESIYYNLIVATQGYIDTVLDNNGVTMSHYSQTKIPGFKEEYIEWIADVNKVVPFYKDIAIKDYVFGVEYKDLKLR